MVKSETLLLLILILFDTQSDTKISHLLIHSPNTHSAWAVPNSRNVIWVSHMDDRDPRTSVTPLFLLRYTLAGSWNWEQTWGSYAGTLIWQVNSSSNVSTTVSNPTTQKDIILTMQKTTMKNLE